MQLLQNLLILRLLIWVCAASDTDDSFATVSILGNSSEPPCYPDSAACRLYGDCCHDVRNRSALELGGLACVSAGSIGVQFNDGLSEAGASVRLAETCPTGAPPGDPDVRLCHTQLAEPRSLFDPRHLPAMSPDGMLFRTAHCARCHGRRRLLWPQVSVLCRPGSLPSGDRNESEDSARQRIDKYLRQELASGRDLPAGCLVATRFPGRPFHRCLGEGVVQHCVNQTATAEQRRLCEDGGLAAMSYPECGGAFRNQACRDCYGRCPELQGWGVPFFNSGGGVLSNVVNFWIPLREPVSSGDVQTFDALFVPDETGGNASSENATSIVTTGGAADDGDSGWAQQLALVVSYAVSILSLTLLLAVYGLLPHLRNRAGKLLMSHAASVLALQAAQLLSLCAGKQLGGGCAALHFIFYFCMVAAFVWAFLFGWDLLRTFASLLRNSAFKPSRYGRFALVGWGIPLILTGLLLGLHLGVGLLDIGSSCRYRPDRVAYMLGLSFGPLVAVLLFNLIIVVLLGLQLVRTYRETRSAGRSSAAKLCVMTAKVSVIMGAAWLPYFLATLADRGRNPGTVGFSAELLCSFHGLLLAVGFTGNRRVRARLSEMTSSVLKSPTGSSEASRLTQARLSQDAGRVLHAQPLLTVKSGTTQRGASA